MSTKLAAPKVEDAIARPRLYDRLDRARERSVVWIGAPAGSGKSTLVASYAQAKGLRCLWYGVDARDADPGTLFYYLGEAARLDATATAPALPVLAMDHPSGTLGFARRFFEAFFQQAGAELLVFDDCHTLPATDRWYDLVREACEAVPAGTTIVMLSRSGPPPMLARLMASSRVTVLGWEDLQLLTSETRELAEARARRLGIDLAGEQLARLEAECDGWAAGVILALECARLSGATARHGVGAASEQLFAYFATEVLAASPPDLRELLLKSAFLPTMTAATLDRMLSSSNHARVLARLTAQNFFVTEHGGSPPSYRYHPLFRDFLLARAREELSAEELAEVERSAAAALAEVGEVESALELFIAVSDAGSAARLIVREAPGLVQQGRGHTLRAWIDRLPAAEMDRDPWLSFWAGTATLASSPSQAVDYCERAFRAFDRRKSPDAFWTAWRALAQAYHVEGSDYRRLRPLVEHALEAHAQRAFDAPELEASILRSVVLAIMAYEPDSPTLAVLARDVLSTPEGRDPEELVLALMFHGFRGELAELRAIVALWERRIARKDSGATFRFWVLLPQVLGALLTGDFAGAQGLIREALDLAERTALSALTSGLMIYAAYAHAALGELPALAVVTDEIADIAESGRRMDKANYHFSTGIEALISGDLSRARHHMQDAVALARVIGSPLAERLHQLGLVEVCIVSGDLSEARRELADLRARVDPMSRILAQSVRLLDARLASLEGDSSRGDALLEEGLAIGETHGFVPVAVPTRVTLIPLVRRALERGIARAYVEALASKFDLPVDPPSRSTPPATGDTGGPPSVPPSFSKALRATLRRLHETRRLAESPLLGASLVDQQVGRDATVDERLGALRDLVRGAVEELARTARTEPAYRALYHTYIDPSPTQLLAADAARMSFGTYRRHLAAGLDEVATMLFLRELAAQAAMGSRARG